MKLSEIDENTIVAALSLGGLERFSGLSNDILNEIQGAPGMESELAGIKDDDMGAVSSIVADMLESGVTSGGYRVSSAGVTTDAKDAAIQCEQFLDLILPLPPENRVEFVISSLGERGEHFKEMFNIHSRWCLRYAGIMHKGLTRTDYRTTRTCDKHHIVPACYYGNREPETLVGNCAYLTPVEHTFAHYCAYFAVADEWKHKMYTSFSLLCSKLLPRMERGELPKTTPYTIKVRNELICKINYLARIYPGGVSKFFEDAIEKYEYEPSLLEQYREKPKVAP